MDARRLARVPEVAYLQEQTHDSASHSPADTQVLLTGKQIFLLSLIYKGCGFLSLSWILALLKGVIELISNVLVTVLWVYNSVTEMDTALGTDKTKNTVQGSFFLISFSLPFGLYHVSSEVLVGSWEIVYG